MTTVSPTPLASSSLGQSSRATSRHQLGKPATARAIQSRAATRRNSPVSALSNHQGFSADAPMLQKISIEDSSDDEGIQPMKLSALTEALLDRKRSSKSPSPQAHSSRSLSSQDPVHEADSAERRREATPSRGILRIRRSPPLEEGIDGNNSPRVVQLSSSKRSAALRRAVSISEVQSVHNSEPRHSYEEYVTPAPQPRKPTSTSRSTSSGISSGDASQSADAYEHVASQRYEGNSVLSSNSRLNGSNKPSEGVQDESHADQVRSVGEQPPASMRIKRVPMGSGTFLRGAPMRRPLRRQDSEENQSPLGDRDENIDDKASNRADENDRQEAVNSRLDRLEDAVGVRDFGADPWAPAGNRPPVQSDIARSQSNMERRPSSTAGRYNNLIRRSTSPPGDSLAENRPNQSQRNSPVFKMAPLPPALPSLHDQENEPPPTFKRNKPHASGILGSFDKLANTANERAAMETSQPRSPERKALAPRSVNTPQREAPPPPKMSVLETATAAAGASTVKSKKKRSHFVVNSKIYTARGRLGQGGSAQVHRVMAENDKLFALKKVNLESCNEDTLRGYKGEIDLLRKLEGVERVVRLFDWEINEQKQSLSILMEIGETDLNRILSVRLNPDDAQLDLTFTRFYWKEMLQCVAAVHAHDIVHSDLKPANFLLVQGRLKLIDFGIANAIDIENTVNVHRETNVGTPNYMSPESLQDTNASKSRTTGAAVAKLMKLGKPSDVWSLGCILYQMVYGKPPFAHIANQWNRVMAIVDPNVHVSYPVEGIGGVAVPFSLRKLLQNCLNRDPAKRPTIAQMLDGSDPFLNPEIEQAAREKDGAVPISEHMLEQILQRVVERCRDPKRGPPSNEEVKGYPKAFLDRLRANRA